MNFLIKIEEAINNLIIHLFEKLKAMAPHFIFVWISFFTHLPATILKKIKPILFIYPMTMVCMRLKMVRLV